MSKWPACGSIEKDRSDFKKTHKGNAFLMSGANVIHLNHIVCLNVRWRKKTFIKLDFPALSVLFPPCIYADTEICSEHAAVYQHCNSHSNDSLKHIVVVLSIAMMLPLQ